MPATAANFGTVSAVALLLALCYALYTRLYNKRKKPLPPGPKGEFLLGHYRIVPFEAPFKQYAKWGEEYSARRAMPLPLKFSTDHWAKILMCYISKHSGLNGSS